MLTAEQMIKREILNLAIAGGDLPHDGTELADDQIDDLYEMLVEDDAHWDYESDFRVGDFETDIPCGHDRNYETKSVAKKLSNGQWVGWTYYYGGGKYGNPEEIEWMEHAYLLDCIETQQMVIVRNFSKVAAESPPSGD